LPLARRAPAQVQAVLALAASWVSRKPEDRTLTGTVVDSGDGVTHVIPVAEGYVIGSCIRHIPLAGRDITAFIQRQLRERGEPVPPEDSLEVAKRIKERFCYISQDIVKEYGKFDADPAKMFKRFAGRNARTRAEYAADVGYEQFLGPELFFNPEVYSSDFTKPLPEVVDESILGCPLDFRRQLYANIVLSGGSTMFTNFHRRLQADIKSRVQERIAANWRKHKVAEPPPDMKVKVVSHDMQRYAVWFGGSMLASTPEFARVCITKQQYAEEGPRCARANAVFNAAM
jgi:actin-related protein 3